MADPKKLFVVSAVSREGIAEALNEYLDDNEALTDDRLQFDDDRLTDEICEAYATGLGEIDLQDSTEAMVEEAECDLFDRVLRMVGIDPSVSD